MRSVVPAWDQPHWPNPGYWVAARLVWEGQPSLAYAPQAVFFQQAARLGTVRDIFEANAPTTLLVFAPLGGLSEQAAHRFWLLFSLGCFLAAWVTLLWGVRVPVAGALALSALVPWFQPWRENIARGQAYPLVFLLAVAAAVGSLPRGAPRGRLPTAAGRALWLAGVACGLLAIVKLYYGLVLVLPLVARRQWTVLAGAGLVFAAAGLGTIVAWGPGLWASALGLSLAWRERPETAVTAYQTLNGWLTHLLRYDAVWNRGPVAQLPALVTPLWWGLALLGGGLTLVVAARAILPPGATPARRLLVPALGIPLALLLVPIAEDYHFLLTLLPLLVAGMVLWETRAAGPGQDRVPRRWLRRWGGPLVWAAAIVLLAPPWPFNVPSVGGWHALLYYPRLYGTLLLWGLVLGLLWPGRARSVIQEQIAREHPAAQGNEQETDQEERHLDAGVAHQDDRYEHVDGE